MKALPLTWWTDQLQYSDEWHTDFMGVVLNVKPDNDGTYSATMRMLNKDPKIQKGFKSAHEARYHAEHVMLAKVLRLHFLI